jgi:hypothetical protein
MSRYWVSWAQETEDYRPVDYPPNRKILGWWCSGTDADDKAILCALVEAAGPSDARDAVYIDWPEATQNTDWRFFEEKPADFVPGDRFPLSDWMNERVQK